MSIFKIYSKLIQYSLYVLLFASCALKPEAWQPGALPPFEGNTALNSKLAHVELIPLQGWYGPEDIVFDDMGNLYCGVHVGENDFSDGKILKISPEGAVSIFYDAGSWVAGLHFDEDRNLLALSHKEGLISISPEGVVTKLVDQDDQGRKFYIPNGLDVDTEGNVYFTNTSSHSPYSITYGRKLILEMKPQGGLFKYSPGINKIETLIDGTYFGNGVVVAKDGSYLLMVETTQYRVIKFGLKGDGAGKTTVFLDNLPGFPNGISVREDGSYWLGFTTKRNSTLDNIHPKPWMKKLVHTLPNWMQPKQERFGMVMHLSESGEILHTYFDPTGEHVPEAGAVKEHGGYLYIGGDNSPYIGRYKLE